jgi:Integrase core domain/Chromo (CHRromatin Organisation MOdifier) domain
MINFQPLQSSTGEKIQFNNISDEEIKRNYTTPGHPTAFSGITQTYKFYRGYVPLQRIKNILSGVEGYTLHKEFRNRPRNITYKHFKRYQFQMDLVEVGQFSEKNDGCRYLLNCIDIFTRYAFVRPLKDKSAKTVLDAFKSILLEAQTKPLMVVMDKGTEFMNQHFKNFCDSQKIKLINPQASVHAAFIERFNRTLQMIIYKYMTENETNRYVDVLQDLVRSYNHRRHRMINMTPYEAEKNENNEHLQLNLIQQKQIVEQKKQKPNLKIGEYVRIAKQKGKFSRSYDEQAMQEIYKIKTIDLRKNIPLYHLTDYDGKEELVGGFYEFELTPVKTETFRIEKVLKKRKFKGKEQLFVKWKGFGDNHNSWIDASNVERVF